MAALPLPIVAELSAHPWADHQSPIGIKTQQRNLSWVRLLRF
jgi:hypothetical protein